MSDGRAAARLWARVDLRRRWPSLVALGVLVGITAGFALSALAGARRTHTALARLEQQTNSPAAMVFASQSGVFDPDFAQLRTRPGVQDIAVWDLVFGNCDGEPGCVLFAPDDARWLSEVNKPVLIAGRMWDPNASDEIVIDENLAKQGSSIGTTVKFEMVGPTIEDLVNNNVNGPSVTLKVVGVVRDVGQFLFATDGQAFLSPGFVPRYRGQGAIHPNADVVLKKGTDVSTLRTDVNDIIGPGTPVLDLHAVERRVNTTLSVERSALTLLALAVAVAGGLLVSQALTRSAGTVGDDALVLRAVGLSRWDIATAAVLSHALSALVAVVVGAASAIVASRCFPSASAGASIPTSASMSIGSYSAPDCSLRSCSFSAEPSSSPRAPAPRVAGGHHRASLFATRIRRRAPLTVGLGATMAFDRGRGRTSIPVLPALIGAVVGVLGVVGALTISSGLHDALAHGERAGVTWDLTVEPPPDAYTTTGDVKPAIASAIRDASGGALALINRQLVPVNGIGAPAFSIGASNGSAEPISFGLLSGRAPRTADEVAIGPATARDLHVKVGDTVQLGDKRVKALIVGEALFPSDVHSEFDEGIWLTPGRLDELVPLDPTMHGRALAVRFPAGANEAKVEAALQSALPQAPMRPPRICPSRSRTCATCGPCPCCSPAFSRCSPSARSATCC